MPRFLTGALADAAHDDGAAVQAKDGGATQPEVDPAGALPRYLRAPAAHASTHAVAREGVAGAARGLPHLERLQRAFGHHDLRHARAQVGGPAESASEQIDALAYTVGDRVGFKRAPSLELAAHEAAHVVQQRRAGGLKLDGGVGVAGDGYERHADEVAAAVARGASAEAILDRAPSAAPATQEKACPTCGGEDCDGCASSEPPVQRQQPPGGDVPAAPPASGPSDGAGAAAPMCVAPAAAPPLLEPMQCPAAPPDVETPIEVQPPTVGDERPTSQTFVLHEPVQSSVETVFYAIPRERVDSADGGAAPVCRAPASSSPGIPSAASTPAASSGSSAPAPQSDDPRHPSPLIVNPGLGQSGGSVTIEGEIVPVERITDAYVIVSQYHHFAVGAGATTLLQTEQGIRLIDAGVGQEGREDLTAAMIDRLSGIIGDQPLLEVILTHLHEDHTSMLPELAARFPISKIVVGGAQFADPRFQELLGEVAAAQAQGVRDRAGRRFDSERERWLEGPGSEIADASAREAAYQSAREAEVARALSALRSAPTTIDLLVPDGGRLQVVSAPIGTVSLPGGPGVSDPVLDAARLAGVPGDASVTAFTDPSSGRQQAELQQEQQKDPTARHEDEDVDTVSTSYIIDLPGGNRLMVVPDVRTSDLRRARKDSSGQVRSNFERALAETTGSSAKFTAWNMTHHMQSGWATGGAPHVVGVGELVGFIELMQNVRDLQRSQRGPGAAPPADVVTVSVQGDPSAPLVRSLVNPGMVWFLRSLGFEVMLATSGRDVRLIEAMTAGGQRIEGISGLPYGGLRPTDPLLMQSEAALRFVDQRIAVEGQRKATPGMARQARTDLKADREANLARLRATRDAIESARNAYLEAISRDIWRGANDASRPAVAPPADATAPPPAMAAAEAALRNAMSASDLADFTPPTAAEVPIVTDAALVLMRLHGDMPLDAEGQRVAELNQELDVLRERLQAGQDVPVTRVELGAKLQEMRTLLGQRIETAPAPTRAAYQEELVTIQRELESIAHAGEGDPIFTRDRAGRLIENRVIASPGERVSTERVQGAIEGAGRVLGGLMVLQTIRSEEQLGERYQAGRANVGEAAVGRVSGAYGVSVGLRMMTGVAVNPFEFVVLSALDITQTAMADYASPEQRAVAMAESTLANGISLALMGIGEAVMEAGGESGNPWMLGAGFALMFLTKPIMMVLDAVGLFDAIERWSAFLPSEVTGANQHLRELMTEYRAIVGALAISARGDDELRALGGDDPAAIRRDARADVGEERSRLDAKEADLMTAFGEAYQRASTDYAGLFELDSMRDQFLRLRRLAHEGQGAGAAARSREGALSGFERIDRSISLDALSPDAVAEMPQWTSLDQAILELEMEILASSPEWDEVRDKELHVEQMLRNARYRIHPEEFGGMRSAPLLAESSPARSAYESQLQLREERMAAVRAQVAAAAAGHGAAPATACTGPVDQVEALLRAYTSLIDGAPARTLDASALFLHSMDAGPSYRSYVRDNSDYAAYLQRLEATETALRAALNAGFHGATPEEAQALRGLGARVESESSRRCQQLGIFYLSEVDARVAALRVDENRQMVGLLGHDPAAPLSPDEERATATGQLGDSARNLSTISNRLEQVNGLRIPESPTEPVGGVYRVVGDIDETDLFIIGIPGTPVTDGQNVLVGLVRAGEEVITGSGHDQAMTVIPLNDAAVRRLGTTRPKVIDRRFLRSVTLGDLRGRAAP